VQAQWSSIRSINSDYLCDWVLGDAFFLLCFGFWYHSALVFVLFSLETTSKILSTQWCINVLTCISSLTLYLTSISLFFPPLVEIYLFIWSSDCIGSAFNVKGAMQCPNCRKIEKGQWLYANGCRSLPEFSMDDWAHDEDLYDLSYSEMVNGFLSKWILYFYTVQVYGSWGNLIFILSFDVMWNLQVPKTCFLTKLSP